MTPVELPPAKDSSGPSQPSDGLDQFRQALSIKDFKSIDKDQSDSLTLNELTDASKDKSFSQEKVEAINGLANHLKNGPKLKLTFGDLDIPIQPIIDSWFKGEHPGTGGGGGGSDKDLDMSKDDPLAKQAEKAEKVDKADKAESVERPKLTEEELRTRLGELGDKVGKSMAPKHAGDQGRTYGRMLNNYFNIQGMWDVSKALPGDPMANMEAAMNSALKDSGHSVKLHKTDEVGTPKHHWMSVVDGYMTIDPPSKPTSKLAEKTGSGVIGLTGH